LNGLERLEAEALVAVVVRVDRIVEVVVLRVVAAEGAVEVDDALDAEVVGDFSDGRSEVFVDDRPVVAPLARAAEVGHGDAERDLAALLLDVFDQALVVLLERALPLPEFLLGVVRSESHYREVEAAVQELLVLVLLGVGAVRVAHGRRAAPPEVQHLEMVRQVVARLLQVLLEPPRPVAPAAVAPLRHAVAGAGDDDPPRRRGAEHVRAEEKATHRVDRIRFLAFLAFRANGPLPQTQGERGGGRWRWL